MSFHVGQRVVCVDDDFGEVDVVLPRVGSVYTVQDVEMIDAGVPTDDRGRTADVDIEFLVLEEFGDGCAWDAIHFRPLDETRLDQFRAHLAPASKTGVSA